MERPGFHQIPVVFTGYPKEPPVITVSIEPSGTLTSAVYSVTDWQAVK